MPGAQTEATSQPGAGDQTVTAQAAAQAAAAAAGQSGANEGGEGQESSLTLDQAMAEIKKLRKENADRRVSSKSLEEKLAQMEQFQSKVKAAMGLEEETSPEETAQILQQQNAALEIELGITQLAMQSGISPDQQDYFRFLLGQELEALEEGQELSEESLNGVLAKVRAVGGQRQSSTGLNTTEAPAPNTSGTVTLEQFTKMNPGEKSALFMKDQGLYERLMTEAVAKKLL